MSKTKKRRPQKQKKRNRGREVNLSGVRTIYQTRGQISRRRRRQGHK